MAWWVKGVKLIMRKHTYVFYRKRVIVGLLRKEWKDLANISAQLLKAFPFTGKLLTIIRNYSRLWGIMMQKDLFKRHAETPLSSPAY